MVDTSSKLHHIFGFNFDEIIAPLITFPLNFDSQVNRVNLYKLKKNNDKNKHGVKMTHSHVIIVAHGPLV